MSGFSMSVERFGVFQGGASTDRSFDADSIDEMEIGDTLRASLARIMELGEEEKRKGRDDNVVTCRALSNDTDGGVRKEITYDGKTFVIKANGLFNVAVSVVRTA